MQQRVKYKANKKPQTLYIFVNEKWKYYIYLNMADQLKFIDPHPTYMAEIFMRFDNGIR